MGMIDFQEWGRVQAQINYAALEMASIERSPSSPASPANDAPDVERPASSPSSAHKGERVFISYSHQDQFAMRSVKAFLHEHGIETYVDLNDISIGESIQGFIDQALKNNDFVLSIISRNSLMSGWVNRELAVVQVLHQLNNNWIPVTIDDALFDNNFYTEALEQIDKRIAELVGAMQAALSKGIDIRPFTEDLNRQQELRYNLGKTISVLKGVMVMDIAGKLFDDGMTKVVKHIKSRKNRR